MLKIILWVAIIGLLFVFKDRIAGGIVGVLTLIGAMFLAIFLWDNFTIFNVREYVAVDFYDETVENPQEKLTEVKDKIVDVGGQAVDKVNEVGEKADEKFNESRPQENIEGSEEVISKNGSEPVVEQNVIPSADININTENSRFVIYGTRNADLLEYYPDLTEKDFQIIASLKNILDITYEGSNYYFTSVKGKDGFYITIKE